MSRFILIVVLGISCFYSTKAQQLPLFSEYTHNAHVVNPAMTGWDDVMAISLGYRHQWASMPEAPRTASLSFRNFSEKNNMGFGGYLLHDQTGPTSFTGIHGLYAYHIKMQPEKDKMSLRTRLSIGLSLSAVQYRLNGADLLVNDMDDDLLFSNNVSKILPDAGFGLFYYSDLFYAGFSIPQMISLNVRYEGDNGLSAIRRVPHIYTNAGVRINLKDPSDMSKIIQSTETEDGKTRVFDKGGRHFLMPSFWVKYTPTSPLNINLSVRYVWERLFGVGIGYTTDGTIIGDFDVHVAKHFRLGYAFSVGVNGLTQHLGTNHEIMLTYMLKGGGKGWFYPRTEPRSNTPE